MRDRRHRGDMEENRERWMVSYADFITLLFAFFVVMYALSSVNEGKYRVLSKSLDLAFQGHPRTLEPIAVGDPVRSPLEGLIDLDALERLAPTQEVEVPEEPPQEADPARALEEISEELENALEDLISEGTVEIRNDGERVEVDINTSILFGSGSAVLSSEAIAVVDKISRVLLDFPHRIQVEGFTDNIPINNPVYPSNWELSAARAAGVVRLLSGNAIDRERLIAIGHGQNHPRAPNDSPQGRATNRRVVLNIPAEDSAVPRGDDAELRASRSLDPSGG